jgi:hypothetical protein
VRNPNVLHPDPGDHPGWKVGGALASIPILYLGGPLGDQLEPLRRHGDNWRIMFDPDGHADAARYLRELAAAATELADQLDKDQQGDTP